MYSSTPYFTIIGVFYDYITTYNHTNLANFGYFFFGGGGLITDQGQICTLYQNFFQISLFCHPLEAEPPKLCYPVEEPAGGTETKLNAHDTSMESSHPSNIQV